MLTNNATYKYETPYNGPFLITQCCTNGTFTLQYGPKNIIHNIRRIRSYTSDKMLKIITLKNMYDDVKM